MLLGAILGIAALVLVLVILRVRVPIIASPSARPARTLRAIARLKRAALPSVRPRR